MLLLLDYLQPLPLFLIFLIRNLYVSLLIKGKSRDLQKLLKYFTQTATSVSNLLLLSGVLPIIFILTHIYFLLYCYHLFYDYQHHYSYSHHRLLHLYNNSKLPGLIKNCHCIPSNYILA